ncbi:MAG: hypothetical protein GY952_03510 [Rhodobacteraceae bacterium]|nr:hypothetical protein [Paracoccaceae bacterium]
MLSPEYNVLLILGFVFLTGLVVLVMVVLKLLRMIRENHGTDPNSGQAKRPKKKPRWQIESDHKLLDTSIHTGPGSDHSNTTSIPKDPQKYAEIFVPDAAKKLP